MNRLLIFVFGMLMAFAAGAQTKDSPLIIVPGENLYTDGTVYQSVFYRYTPSEDCLVTLEGLRCTPTVDGEEIPAYSAYDPEITVFAAQAGKVYDIEYFALAMPIRFTMTAKSMPYNPGTSCADPIVAENGMEIFVPCFQQGYGMSAKKLPAYVRFSATTSDQLTIKTPAYFGTVSYGTDCADEFTTLAPISGSDGNTYTVDAIAGTDYLVKFEATTPTMATFTLGSIKEGTSCEFPFEAAIGANNIPAEAGSWWYSMESPSLPDKMFAMVTSESAAQLIVRHSCASVNSQTSEIPVMRFPIVADDSRVLEFVKADGTVDDETFDLSFEPFQLYDAFSTAPSVAAGIETTTPAFGGTYYYKIESPATGSWFLDIDPQGDYPAGTEIELYSSDNDLTTLAKGSPAIHYLASNSKTYVLQISLPATRTGLVFIPSFNEVKKGETLADPLEAELGSNDLPAWRSVYYRYTPENDRWYEVAPADKANVPAVTSGADGYGNVTLYPNDNGWRFEGVAGTAYNIVFLNVATPSTFTLTGQDYEPGEHHSNPIAVQEGETMMPSNPGVRWYEFTCPSFGNLEVATNVKYNFKNKVYIYLGEPIESNRNLMATNGDFSDLKFVPFHAKVRKDEKIYVCVEMAEEQSDASLSIEVLPSDTPGETPQNPIVIDFSTNPMDYDFTKPVYPLDDPLFYSIELDPGIFTLQAKQELTMLMFADDDLQKEIARSTTWVYDNENLYGFRQIPVKDKGNYILQINQAINEFTATLSMRAPRPGELPQAPVAIEVTSNPMIYTMEHIGYLDFTRWYSIDLVPGTLSVVSPEVYIGASLYSGNDWGTSLYTAVADKTDEGFGLLDVEIPAAGTYLFALEHLTLNTDVRISGSSLGIAGIDRVVGTNCFSATGSKGAIDINGTGRVDIYDTAGIKVSSVDCNGSAIIPVAPGLYIVRFGNCVAKVVVR